MSIKGLDVSEFQGEVDWEKVKAAGYQFAMIRAGYGYNTVDRQFHRNASECNRIGLPIGVYWFCYALTPEIAAQEAEGCLNTISACRLDYPVCYDIEQASVDYAKGQGVTVTPALAKQLVQSFCNKIEKNGYFAMFYTNRNFLDTYIGTAMTTRYAYWYARYTDTYDGTDCGIWQYSSTGSIPASAAMLILTSDIKIIRQSYALPASTTCPAVPRCHHRPLRLLRQPGISLM